MYHRIQAYFAGVKPVWVDGTIYVLLALSAAVGLTFNNDDIYKYVTSVKFVFWTKNMNVWIGATLLAMKMFRSTSYSDHLESKVLTDGNTKATITSIESISNETKIESKPSLPDAGIKPSV